MKGQNMQDVKFMLSIEQWWFTINLDKVIYLDINIVSAIAIALITVAVMFGVNNFKERRARKMFDTSLGLLGTVYPKKNQHGPAAKNFNKGI
jgi:hypothetical protein